MHPISEGAGKVSRHAATTAMLWMALAKVGRGASSSLMAVATALARAQALMSSIITTGSISSAGLLWCKSVNWASMAARLPVSSPCRCAALRTASTC
jgi:hypothetical protein